LVFGIGYPQINNRVWSGPDGPRADAGHFFVAAPYLQSPILWHEWGHCNVVDRFDGEREAVVNFPYAYVRNVLLGEDLEVAFGATLSRTGTWTIDNAAIDWMVRTYFRQGEEMVTLGYVHKGYAKYADIVRLFGWDVIKSYHYKIQTDVYELRLDEIEVFSDTCEEDMDIYKEQVPVGPAAANTLTGTERRILHWSIEAGVDLSPLIHFWGRHPTESGLLKEELDARNIPLSSKIYVLLWRYLTLIPNSKEAFQSFAEKIYPGYEDAEEEDYGAGWYARHHDKFDKPQVDDAYYAGTSIIDRYYDCPDATAAFEVNGSLLRCEELRQDRYRWACDYRIATQKCATTCNICDRNCEKGWYYDQDVEKCQRCYDDRCDQCYDGAETSCSKCNYLTYSVDGECVDLINVALMKTATQSKTYRDRYASLAVDGNPYPGAKVCASTNFPDPWWEVDLAEDFIVKYVTLVRRGDCCKDKLDYADVDLLDENRSLVATIEYGRAVPVMGFNFWDRFGK